MYADLYVTNGNFCEKIKPGSEFYTVQNFPINRAKLIQSPSKYLEGVNDTDFYWKSIGYTINEKLNFTNTNNFLNDLKCIMSMYLELIPDKERVHLLINSLEKIEIKESLFKVDSQKISSFIPGKEISLYINLSSLIDESFVIFGENIYHFIKQVMSINQCISLNIIDINSKRTVHTCMPTKGFKTPI